MLTGLCIDSWRLQRSLKVFEIVETIILKEQSTHTGTNKKPGAKPRVDTKPVEQLEVLLLRVSDSKLSIM